MLQRDFNCGVLVYFGTIGTCSSLKANNLIVRKVSEIHFGTWEHMLLTPKKHFEMPKK
jgi:hypothetical protein